MAVHTAPALNILAQNDRAEMHLWPQEPKREAGFVTYSVVIECGGTDSQRLWYRVPEEYESFVLSSCDPFVIGLIFMAMERKNPVHVHGQVSPTLLENLAEFQMIWQRWRPNKYSLVQLTADAECEQPRAHQSGKAVCAFTGGIDSSFTIYRHKKQLCGRSSKDVEAALFVHGFDIPLEDSDAFLRASSRIQETLSSIDVKLVTIATNHKELNPDWDYTHGAGIASCLALLSGRYEFGLLGATYTYRFLDKIWGSHPLTDRFFSTGGFRVVHDSAGFGRAGKLRSVADWPEAYNNLRVCWSAPRKDENCGRCGKCVMTVLSSLYFGLPLPESFPTGISEDTLLQLKNLDQEHTTLMDLSLSAFKCSAVPAKIVRALDRCVKYNKRRLLLENPAKNPVQQSLRRLALDLHTWRSP